MAKSSATKVIMEKQRVALQEITEPAPQRTIQFQDFIDARIYRIEEAAQDEMYIDCRLVDNITMTIRVVHSTTDIEQAPSGRQRAFRSPTDSGYTNRPEE